MGRGQLGGGTARRGARGWHGRRDQPCQCSAGARNANRRCSAKVVGVMHAHTPCFWQICRADGRMLTVHCCGYLPGWRFCPSAWPCKFSCPESSSCAPCAAGKLCWRDWLHQCASSAVAATSVPQHLLVGQLQLRRAATTVPWAPLPPCPAPTRCPPSGGWDAPNPNPVNPGPLPSWWRRQACPYHCFGTPPVAM